MADLDNVIKGLEEIRSSLIPAIAQMYGSGFSSVYACEKTDEKFKNAIDLLKSQQEEVERLKKDNELMVSYNSELEEQRTDFAMMIEKQHRKIERLKKENKDIQKSADEMCFQLYG